jgi:predicted DsbA family dithiol-disulfide isomerase
VSSSLEELKASHGIRVQWHSYELRPQGAPPVPAEYRERILADRPRLKAIAWEHYGLEINAGTWGISSRAALIGAKYAEAQGKGETYHPIVLRGYWQQALDISDLTVLSDLAVEAGLERAAFLAALKEPDYEAAVDRDILQAYQMGLSGVPALIFESKYYVAGAQPYDVLVNVVEKLQMMQP